MGEKRGNENAQMRREDYEAQQEREEGESPEVTYGIPRASEEQMKTRRIVRARRPLQRPQQEQNAGDSVNPFAKLMTPTDTATASTNPFAKLLSTSGNNAEKPSFSFGSTPASQPHKPSFSFCSTPTQPASQPEKPSFSFGTGVVAAAQTPSPFDLEKAIKDSLKELDPEIKSSTSRLDTIIKSAAQQIHEWARKNPESTSTTEQQKEPSLDTKKDESTTIADSRVSVATETTATEDSKPDSVADKTDEPKPGQKTTSPPSESKGAEKAEN